MAKIQALTLAGVKRAARKAFAARKLMAQHPKKESRVCVYQSGAYNCGIGAALSKTTLKAIEAHDKGGGHANGVTVSGLVEKGLITLPDDHNEHYAIFRIQSAHDNWANAARLRGSKEARPARNKFVELINA